MPSGLHAAQVVSVQKNYLSRRRLIRLDMECVHLDHRSSALELRASLAVSQQHSELHQKNVMSRANIAREIRMGG
jgi:hypothetical protein